MNTLLIEIIACLAAAALFSLFIGWAIRGSVANRQLKHAEAKWQSKHEELQLQYDQDTAQLSDDIQHLDSEIKQLNARNTNMSESLRDNEISVHKARADAIELNRQQANTQERLQRIIAQKDEEITTLKEHGVTTDFETRSEQDAQREAQATSEKIASLSAKREAWERERATLLTEMGDEQATVVIDPDDIPLDKTVRINPEQLADIKSKGRERAVRNEQDSDKTQTLDDADQTISLDYHDPLRPETKPKAKPKNRPLPGGSPEDND